MATESDLVFSSQANHNFSRILTDLKRSNLSITNRLRSIREDAGFVADVANAFARPLVANERCGSWYITPENKVGSAYFKSTDGHTGQWKFSTRRLNLHLLKIIGDNDGCIIVDSTRRGKRMPDALSKTVPIWCCVLNRVLFPRASECHGLYSPPNTVSQSEHAQMESRIPEHVASLEGLDLNIDSLKGQIIKPIRPMWVTQESQLVPTDEIFDNFHPVICCTSSRRVLGGEMSEGGYIQGAGDDTENWALGLTPPVFWSHEVLLSSTPEPGLLDIVRTLVAEQIRESSSNTDVPKKLATCLFVSCLPLTEPPMPSPCMIALHSRATEPSTWIKGPLLMEVGIGKHKVASRNLRVALPHICDFVRQFLETATPSAQDLGTQSAEQRRLIIACETGRDLSIGVALALMCRYFDDKGNVNLSAADSGINKSVIRVKLGRIMMALPEANPSRATLQSVNSFLMG